MIAVVVGWALSTVLVSDYLHKFRLVSRVCASQNVELTILLGANIHWRPDIIGLGSTST